MKKSIIFSLLAAAAVSHLGAAPHACRGENTEAVLAFIRVPDRGATVTLMVLGLLLIAYAWRRGRGFQDEI